MLELQSIRMYSYVSCSRQVVSGQNPVEKRFGGARDGEGGLRQDPRGLRGVYRRPRARDRRAEEGHDVPGPGDDDDPDHGGALPRNPLEKRGRNCVQ